MPPATALNLLALFAFVCVGCPSQLEAQTASPPVAATPTTDEDRVPFLAYSAERMTIPVLSGGETFNFLIDTGAELSALSSEAAARMNLATVGSASVTSFSGTRRVATVRVPEMRISRIVRNDVDVLTFPNLEIGADGFLGLDALQDKKVDFDFIKEEMTFRNAGRMGFARDIGSVVIHTGRKQGRLVFSDATVTKIPTTVLLDTGSDVTVGNAALRDQLRAKGRLGQTIPIKMLVITGEVIDAEYGLVEDVTLPGVQLRRMPMAFATIEPFRALGLEGRPALLLGMDALRAFGKVSVDFKNRSVRFIARSKPEINTHIFGS